MSAGDFHVQGDWIVVEVDGHTCAGGGEWPHEPTCGVEPVLPVAEFRSLLGVPDVAAIAREVLA